MRKTGTQFGTGFALLTLLLLAVLFYFYLIDYFNPNQKVEFDGASQSLLLRQSYDGHYRVSGTINGYPVVFMLDTGASGIALSARLAEKIGLRKGNKGRSYTANGVTEEWATRLATIEIGGLVMHDVGAAILPNMDDEVLLGMSYLRHFHWQQRKGELILTPLSSSR